MLPQYNAPMRQFLGLSSLMESRPTGYGTMAPMGAGGQAAGQWAGNQLGNWLGIPGLGGVGGALGNLLPFQAGPGGYGAVNPMGAGGQAIGSWAGNQLGNWLGIPSLGGLGGTLGDLLPFQAGPAAGGTFGALGGAAVSPFGATAGPTTVDPETQAINDLTRVATSCAIQKLYEYLNANSATHTRLEEVIPVVKQATDAYGQGNYGQAFIAVYQAFLGIAVLRAQVADLPAL